MPKVILRRNCVSKRLYKVYRSSVGETAEPRELKFAGEVAIPTEQNDWPKSWKAEPDVIVSNTTPATAALHRETNTVPVVFAIVSDPVGDGFVASLAQPGGNITGFINLEASIAGKWLELLKEFAPHLRKAAVMFNPDTAAGNASYFHHSFETAARSLSITPLMIPVSSDADIEAAISTLGGEPGGGIIMMSELFMTVHRGFFIEQAARYKIPTILPNPRFCMDGGLVCYGPDSQDIFRRVAPYVDRILRGAKPSDLPVQLPTKFELVINLKTAKALGIPIPPTLLGRADEVVE
jgi:putative ABC transport system substrate-binding protein